MDNHSFVTRLAFPQIIGGAKPVVVFYRYLHSCHLLIGEVLHGIFDEFIHFRVQSGTLPKTASYFQTQHGSKLLTDGWWGWARKLHYTMDLCMALSWGLICGFGSMIPYFYVCFFTAVLTHRVARDQDKMRRKYGDADWRAYTARVPYLFVPYVY